MTSGKPFSDSLKRPAKKKFLAGLLSVTDS